MPLETGFTIPLSVLLIPLGLFLIFYVFYSIFNVYHLLRFGVYGFGLYLITTLFVLGTIFLLSLSSFFLLRYDWSAPIQLDPLLDVSDTTLPGI